MSVTVNCPTCGVVAFDDIKRDLQTRTDGDDVIETITVSCSRCGGSSSTQYRTPRDKWMLLNGYSGQHKRSHR